MSSRHHKNKGFSQTTKKYDGELKAQKQQSRNSQMNPMRHQDEEDVQSPSGSGAATSSKRQ